LGFAELNTILSETLSQNIELKSQVIYLQNYTCVKWFCL